MWPQLAYLLITISKITKDFVGTALLANQYEYATIEWKKINKKFWWGLVYQIIIIGLLYMGGFFDVFK